ncbi:MAG TPA: hypothetical protein PKK99_14955, partial [Bacteroidia bacterium]|nr:hypothetical protein [Bacteroidia bacterium]
RMYNPTKPNPEGMKLFKRRSERTILIPPEQNYSQATLCFLESIHVLHLETERTISFLAYIEKFK